MLYLWSAMAKSAIITKNYRDKKNYQDTILTVSTAKCTHPIFLSSTSFSWLIYITFLSSTCFSYPTSLRNLPRHHWPPWRVLRCERGAMEVLVSENTFQTTEDSVESSAGKTPCESPENLLPMMFKSSPILTWLVNQKKKKIYSKYNPTSFVWKFTELHWIFLLLTLDICWGYGRWAGKGSVQRSWHERKKPCTMIRGASWTRDVLRVDRSDSPTSNDRQAGMSSCAVFCHGEFFNDQPWKVGPYYCFFSPKVMNGW